MTIAIDASRLTTTKHPTGVEVYCREIISGLIKLNSDVILYTPKLIPDLPKETQRHSRFGVPQIGNVFGFPKQNQKILSWPFKFWSQIRLGLELFFNPPDVFFSPGYTIPQIFLLNKKTRKIITIHDIAFIRQPKSYSVLQRCFLNLTTRQAVKYAYKIITPTEAVKNDLIKYFNCASDKIVVTYFGISNQLSAIDYQLSTNRKKQILYIGRIESKKNIGNLIKAFEIFHEKFQDYKLILAGKPGIGFPNHQSLITGHQFIDYKGYINNEEKEKLLSESTAFVFVSKEEGFGFPILEALAFNLPVVASNISALKEIGADTCLYVDPDSPENIAQGLAKITQDEKLRQELITRGQVRLKQFNWQKCAQKTTEVLIN